MNPSYPVEVAVDHVPKVIQLRAGVSSRSLTKLIAVMINNNSGDAIFG